MAKKIFFKNVFKVYILATQLFFISFANISAKEDVEMAGQDVPVDMDGPKEKGKALSKGDKSEVARVYYFNMQEIIASVESPLIEVKDMQEQARKELEGQMRTMQEEGMKLRQEEEEFKRNLEMLNDEERAKKEADIMQRQMAAAQKVQEFQRHVERKTAEISQKAMELIAKAIEKITSGKNAMCDIVVPLPYKCNAKFDITAKIITQINKEYSDKKKTVEKK